MELIYILLLSYFVLFVVECLILLPPLKLSRSTFLLFLCLIITNLTTSLSSYLFPLFFPQLAEEKSLTLTMYCLVFGVVCLTSFLGAPIIGGYYVKYFLIMLFSGAAEAILN